MTTAAQIATGVHLQVGDGASPTEAFVTISEIVDIDGPKISAKTEDATHLLSTWREFIGGLADGGQIALTMNWLTKDAKQQQMYSDVATGTKRNYKIVMNDGTTPTTIPFAAVVTDYSTKMSTGAKLTATATLKVSGPISPAWTTGS